MRTIDQLVLTLALFLIPIPLWLGLQTAPAAGAAGAAAADTLVLQKQFRDAMSAYQRAEFDRAIDILADVAYNAEAGRMLRRDALHMLGRSYVARREEDRAREALTSLVDLEPPRIELDPDIESPHLMRVYYEVRKACNDGYGVEHLSPGLKTMAVVDFTNSSIDQFDRMQPLAKGLPSLMIAQLNSGSQLKVVERERIQWLLDELDLQRDPGRVDQETAVRAGKLLGVHAVLLGSYIVFGKDMILSARLVNVETGEIMMTEQIKGRADDFYSLAQDLSLAVAKGISVTLEETELGTRTETRSLDAMMSYSEGLERLDRGEYEQAYAKFREALEFDPAYTRARTRAESLRPLLASAG